MTKPLEERLWARVEKTATCWLWRGATMPNGYGVIQRGRRSEGTVLVHRACYELTHGPIPAGSDIRHACDVRNCVRPDHLSIGTRADNMADAVARDRIQKPTGDAHWRTRVPDATVALIRERLASGRYRQKDIATEFGVDDSYVSNIKANRYRVRRAEAS